MATQHEFVPYVVEISDIPHGKMIDLTMDSITVDIESIGYDAFVIPDSLLGKTPQCAVPSASGTDFLCHKEFI